MPFNEPELGDRFTIVTLADQRGLVGDDLADLGAFTELDLPDLGPDAIIRPVYSLDRIELVMACPADLDVNGVLDLDDVAAFVDRFLGDDPVADLTLDGAINLDDVARFVASYLAGCG
ncbi:MAG: GC-type dockerin domain-anchored protein [Phycisphaerales bacterium]